MNAKLSLAALALMTTTVGVAQAESAYPHKYSVTITNITKGVSITPFIAAAHKNNMRVFHIGETASEEIVAIAEGGNIAPLQEKLSASKKVFDIASSEGLLGPGESVTLELDGKNGRLTLASMLLPTNDTFVSLNGVRLPWYGKVTYLAKAYDAGSENNDELCANIPGPTCGGAALSPEDAGEGYVYPSPTLHGEGDLSVEAYGWSGPVAKVTVEKMW